MIAYKKTGGESVDGFCLDMSLADFRDVVDYFIAYLNDSVQAGSAINAPRGTIRGVKINCVGEMKLSRVAEFVEVEVPKHHQVFSASVAPISRLVGLPLHALKYPPNEAWTSFQNTAATFLHLEPDPTKTIWESDMTKSTWGWAPMVWQSDVENVLMVHSDNKDITKYQVEALCHYCRYKMQPLFEAWKAKDLK